MQRKSTIATFNGDFGMARVSRFWRSVGRRGPVRIQKRYPRVTVKDIEFWHPDSVFHSLLSRTNWIARLDISPTAKRLTRLNGRPFRLAVQDILATNLESDNEETRPLQADSEAVRQARPTVRTEHHHSGAIKSDIQPSNTQTG